MPATGATAPQRRASATPAHTRRSGCTRQWFWLMSAIALSYLALGLGTALTTVYLTVIERCPLNVVAAVLTCSGILAVAAAPAGGRLGDRIGPTPAFALLLAAQCAGRTLLAATDSRSGTYAAIICANALGPAAVGLRGALIAELADERRTMRAARGRSIANIGFAIGAALSGSALEIDTAKAFHTALTASAILTGLACIAALRLPQRRSTPHEPTTVRTRPRSALTNLPFLGIAASVGGLLMIYDDVLATAFPLTIAHSLHAPAWTCSAALLINASGVGIAQVAVTRRITTIQRAVRAELAAAALMAAGCAQLGWVARSGPWLAVGTLLASAILLTAAEILQTAGAIALSYGLAPPNHHGEYQGVFSAGYAALCCLTPTILALVVTHPSIGWHLTAATLLFTATTIPVLTSLSQQRR